MDFKTLPPASIREAMPRHLGTVATSRTYASACQKMEVICLPARCVKMSPNAFKKPPLFVSLLGTSIDIHECTGGFLPGIVLLHKVMDILPLQLE